MKLQLVDKKQIAPNTISFYFRPDGPFIWKPGQFLHYRIPQATPDDRGENRFFSIASAPHEGPIQLTTRFSPEGSSFKKELQKLEVGQSIEAEGPKGSFSMDDPRQQYVFIAGGIGITPFRAILKDLDYNRQPMNISLLYANRIKDALFKEEFVKLAKKHPEFKLFYFISDEPVAEQKLSDNVSVLPGQINQNAIQTLIPNFQSAIYYISGPETMVYTFEEMLSGLGVPKENTKRDYFPGYESY